jgi:hypothetical protein
MRVIVITTAALGFVLGLGLSAYHVRQAGATRAAVSVDGTWALSLQGPDGAVTLPVRLEQTGDGIVGIIGDAATGDLTVNGEISGRALSFSASRAGETGDISLHFTGVLRDDGSLSGTVAAPTGEISWAARRVPGQNVTRPVSRLTPTVRSA